MPHDMEHLPIEILQAQKIHADGVVGRLLIGVTSTVPPVSRQRTEGSSDALSSPAGLSRNYCAPRQVAGYRSRFIGSTTPVRGGAAGANRPVPTFFAASRHCSFFPPSPRRVAS